MKRTWQRNGLPSTPPPSHNLLDKEAEQEHHVPVKRNRDMKEKMPKIDTLDALDDEMTSILNTL